jgi:hypothetical protein
VNAMSIYSWLGRCALLLCLPAAAGAYECSAVAGVSSAWRFDDNRDGTLTDLDSGLTWMRCALGQHWDGHTCRGQPARYDWQAAQQAARQLNASGGFAGSRDWRLPRLPELAGIVARECRDPRINLQLFPATPPALFWSSSGKPMVAGQAYALGFGQQGAMAVDKGESHSVRLVRGE